MAKPLSEKSRIIRAALGQNPEVGNKELASELSKRHPELEFKPGDIAAQRMAVKRAGAGADDGEEEGASGEQPSGLSRTAPAAEGPSMRSEGAVSRQGSSGPTAAGSAPGLGPADFRTLTGLARKVGGWRALKLYVDTFAEEEGSPAG